MDEPIETEEDLLDIRAVSETQIACSGADLVDMLNCDEGVDEALFARLNLTPHIDDSLDFEFVVFDEIKEESYYCVSFPEGTNFSDFSIAQAYALEEISEKCFNDLADDDTDYPCDGDCDNCPQDCIGKIPVEN